MEGRHRPLSFAKDMAEREGDSPTAKILLDAEYWDGDSDGSVAEVNITAVKKEQCGQAPGGHGGENGSSNLMDMTITTEDTIIPTTTRQIEQARR